jgi:hypothetical protein
VFNVPAEPGHAPEAAALDALALLAAWQVAHHADGFLMVPGMGAGLSDEARALRSAAARMLADVGAAPPPGWLMASPAVAPLAGLLRGWEQAVCPRIARHWGYVCAR